MKKSLLLFLSLFFVLYNTICSDTINLKYYGQKFTLEQLVKTIEINKQLDDKEELKRNFKILMHAISNGSPLRRQTILKFLPYDVLGKLEDKFDVSKRHPDYHRYKIFVKEIQALNRRYVNENKYRSRRLVKEPDEEKVVNNLDVVLSLVDDNISAIMQKLVSEGVDLDHIYGFDYYSAVENDYLSVLKAKIEKIAGLNKEDFCRLISRLASEKYKDRTILNYRVINRLIGHLKDLVGFMGRYHEVGDVVLSNCLNVKLEPPVFTEIKKLFNKGDLVGARKLFNLQSNVVKQEIKEEIMPKLKKDILAALDGNAKVNMAKFYAFLFLDGAKGVTPAALHLYAFRLIAADMNEESESASKPEPVRLGVRFAEKLEEPEPDAFGGGGGAG